MKLVLLALEALVIPVSFFVFYLDTPSTCISYANTDANMVYKFHTSVLDFSYNPRKSHKVSSAFYAKLRRGDLKVAKKTKAMLGLTLRKKNTIR